MRPRRSKKDLSKISGNPTSALQDAYAKLMSIDDPQELYDAAIAIVKPLVGSGVSEANYRKFENTLYKNAERGVDELKYYLSMYILNGSGMGVESNNIKAMASFITEDCDEIVDLTEEQLRLQKLVESNTNFKVVPDIDRERYTSLEHAGLEGPFRLPSGKVVYYDTKEGKYYDRDSDIYLSNDDYAAHTDY